METETYHDTPYLDLLRDVLSNGVSRGDRTGTGTRGVFGRQLRFDISTHVPILTTKRIYWKSCILELLWFLRGQTNVRHLQERGVKIWNGNSTREFLDANGLSHLEDGELGPIYGFQWRHFGGKYLPEGGEDEKRGRGDGGFDQIQYIIRELKTNPTSRRLVLSAWNPQQMSGMALPPCHIMCQFYVEEPNTPYTLPKLSCHMYQRSVDVFLGLPFNILSYTALTYLLAEIVGMTPHELIISTGDTHIYNDHLQQVWEQLSRSPFPSPTMKISSATKEKELENVELEDFEITDYVFHPAIVGAMSA